MATPFEIGVGVPIRNNSFKFGKRYQTTLASDAASGANSVTLTVTSPTAEHHLKSGDRLMFGASSDATDSGKRESKLVSSVSGSVVTLLNVLDYNYDAGDEVWGICTRLAEGWDIGHSNIVPVSIDAGGYDDRYAQKLTMSSINGGSERFYQADIERLRDSTKYRLLFYYKLTQDIKVQANLNDSQSDFISETLDDEASWTEHTKVAVSGSGIDDEAELEFLALTGASALTFEVDCICLEHDAQIWQRFIDGSVSTAGYYTFTEYPDLGSIQCRIRGAERYNVLSNNDMRAFNPTGVEDKNQKHEFTCQFSNVSQAFWDAMVNWQKWQALGHQLVFHPKGIDDLPPFLYGYMKLENPVKNIWDLTKRSFTFVFNEA